MLMFIIIMKSGLFTVKCSKHEKHINGIVINVKVTLDI